MGEFCLYGAFRLLLWLAAAALALFPTVWALDSWGLSIVWDINEHKHFRDLFFLLAPTSALALATTLDYIWGNNISRTARNAAIMALLANIFVLLSGFLGFFTIQDDTKLNDNQFHTFCWVIAVGMILTLATELWISGAGERRRQLQQRNWNDVARVRQRVAVLNAERAGGRNGRRRRRRRPLPSG
jgi:hypothetical protein